MITIAAILASIAALLASAFGLLKFGQQKGVVDAKTAQLKQQVENLKSADKVTADYKSDPDATAKRLSDGKF
jgi:hypothetical protein